jgi:hypothetical protein
MVQEYTAAYDFASVLSLLLESVFPLLIVLLVKLPSLCDLPRKR